MCRCRKLCCCASIHPSGTAKRWRYGAPAPCSGQSLAPLSAAMADRQLQLALGVLHQLYGLPIGIVAFLGILRFHSRGPVRRGPSISIFLVSAALGVALGALQMLLDRGEVKGLVRLDRDLDHGDLARLLLGLYLFIVHIGYDERAVVPRSRPNAGPQFVVGLLCSCSLCGRDHVLATLALMPTMLQQSMSVSGRGLAGLVIAPRGIR